MPRDATLREADSDNLVYFVSRKWMSIDCIDCGESIDMPDMWMLQMSRSGDQLTCPNCECLMVLSRACIDGIEG